jgi:hypothetical protein
LLDCHRTAVTTYMELLVKPEILTSYIYVILWHSCV